MEITMNGARRCGGCVDLSLLDISRSLDEDPTDDHKATRLFTYKRGLISALHL